jgi:hypothetical protein
LSCLLVCVASYVSSKRNKFLSCLSFVSYVNALSSSSLVFDPYSLYQRLVLESGSHGLVTAFKLVSEEYVITISDDHQSFLGLALDHVTDISDNNL